jgi:predicted metal-dependent hydrolase
MGGRARVLPDFSVRVSNRARHVRLVITAGGDLTVVVPRRFDQRRIGRIVEEKIPWIERTRARLETRRAAAEALAALDDGSMPECVELPALGEVWAVEYRARPAAPAPRGGGRSGSEAGRAATSGRGATVRQAVGGRLIVTGPAGDDEAARAALIRWVRRRAQEELPARLEELASFHRLPFGAVTVRHQRTRWGSCSPEHAISLNLRLLFLEPELVDHVLIHELCHTRELNHSKRFWALMQVHDPDWKTHRRRAREAWRVLPRWLHAGDGGPEL